MPSETLIQVDSLSFVTQHSPVPLLRPKQLSTKEQA